MMDNLINLLPIFGIIALVYMMFLSSWVKKQDAGDAKMQSIANAIAEGAMAFLKAEYRILAVFVLISSVALYILSSKLGEHSSPMIVVSFIVGALFSAIAGNIGMRIATQANVRT
ncbi:MAG: sodium/proton-translocating pyrophosphatase, partial [Chitinophagales bacterium]|nr:sodium/proton-translocating pyrophosphatase [Chitinophagales bacterium]